MIRTQFCNGCGHRYRINGIFTSFMLRDCYMLEDLFVYFPLCFSCLYRSSLWRKIVCIFKLSKKYKKRRFHVLLFGYKIFTQRRDKKFASKWTEEERELLGRKDSWSGVTIKNGKVVR